MPRWLGIVGWVVYLAFNAIAAAAFLLIIYIEVFYVLPNLPPN